MRLRSVIGIVVGAALVAAQEPPQTGVNPDWPRWCGKVYQQGYPNYDPGGQTREPPLLPNGPGLHVQFRPRYSIYLSSESVAHFVVNAEISPWFGSPWPNITVPATSPRLWFNINIAASNDILVENSVAVNTTGNIFSFDLSRLEPSLEPYTVVLFGAAEPGEPNITATTELWYLPEKTSGSVARLDNLHGGLWFRNSKTNGKFAPLVPWGFYAQYDGFLRLEDHIPRVQAYADLGMNAMVPLTTIWDSKPAFEYMDKIDMKFMYDLRWFYKNLTTVRDMVTAIKDFDSLFSYWGSDEPDGWQDAFNLTLLSRDLIKSIDPYHPIATTLNCQNYYFGEYTAGADYVMEDAYPIGINSTFSKWGTACNETYGDCGCDNCQGNVQDVSSRLDDLAQYERWLGLWPKTKAHNPQSFHGENYWLRDPTVAEEVVMNALAFNHDAKGIISWVWPTSDDLARIHGEFAKVVTRSPVVDMVVGSKAVQVVVEGQDIVDVSFWVLGGKMLVNVVNGGYVDVDDTLDIAFPAGIRPQGVSEAGRVWGDVSDWVVLGGKLHMEGLPAMSAGMVILDL